MRNVGLSRRRFLEASGTTLLGAAARQKLGAASLPPRPNVLLLLTDQERYPRYWPDGWVQKYLPNRQRLADTGLSFTRAYCNTCMCSPSRSSLFTGMFPAQHGVTGTLTTGGVVSPTEPQLPRQIPNMARVLSSAGYNVQYRGKWHISKSPSGERARPEDVAAYGFKGWLPPDGGYNIDPSDFGGGQADLDTAYTSQAQDFLRTQTPDSTRNQPFALILSLVNPHDVLAYPQTADLDQGYRQISAKYHMGINSAAIPSIGENLLANRKPAAQALLSAALTQSLGPIRPQPFSDADDYVNFYAYLQALTDVHIGSILDTLDQQGLRQNTIVIRTSDHGEMGLSHGGLRQKMFNIYEETVNVPLVFSNPLLFPEGKTTQALASLVDVIPTMAALAGLDLIRWDFRGEDLTPVLADPGASVRDSVLFTFDDENIGQPNGQRYITQPNHIRAIIQDRWKYARYFDPAGAAAEQYEMYDLSADPAEMNNLAGVNHDKQAELAASLAALERNLLAPSKIHWPRPPRRG